MTTYSGFIIGPKLSRGEILALAELIPEPERFDWHHGTVQQRRFVGRPIWRPSGDKVVRSEQSWFLWIEKEEGDGYDFTKLPMPEHLPIVVSLSTGCRLTLWDGFHRVALSIVNNIDPLHVRVGIERY